MSKSFKQRYADFIQNMRTTSHIPLRVKNLYSTLLQDGDIFYDVGANLGDNFAPLVQDNIKIVAIEPQKELQASLKERFGDRIVIVPYAVGAKPSVEPFFVSNYHTLSSLSTDWIKNLKETNRFEDADWDTTQTIEVVTLDHLIEIYGKPSYIKIDVEGYELEALKGLSIPIRTISLECALPESLEQTVACINRLEEIAGKDQLLINYATEQTYRLKLDQWITPAEFIKLLHTHPEDFHFCDVFARMLNV